ncbi:uncharacterized protein LOC133190364 [Saccostrea echinata]|uniref:uncharacterized protein LOC133190364 n=1 Tax=Saccostrea echinata TaxID=191078 RepID=UPI002A83EDBA|nr:uncharacterized protein LOC133190364 [Saccostrea echinata]
MIEAVALYFVSEDCGPWANFLKTKLGEKAYDIRVQDIEASSVSESRENYKANIILVSPAFLELPTYEHYCSFPIKQSLVVLLGVEYQEFEELATSKGAENILGFPLFETEANESSVRCLLVEIIDLYERNVALEELVQPHPIPGHLSKTRESDNSFDSEYDPYDFPPAPRPLPEYIESPTSNELQKFIYSEKDSKIYLLMERKDEENILIQDENRPDTCVQCKYLGKALYEASLTDDFDRTHGLKIVTTKRRNVETIRIEPSSEPAPRDKLSQIQQLLNEELEPLTVLCKALRLPEVSHSCLDTFLAEKCSNFKMFDTLQSLSLGENLNEKHLEGSNWPTLLHFGAEFGLSLFCDELLRVPGMDKFCHVTNAQDEAPGQLARNRGFLQLAEKLDMLTVTQRDKRNPPANKDSGISDMHTSAYSQVSDTSSYAPSHRAVDSLLEDETYQMPPPTPHQHPQQYYINSNPISPSKTDSTQTSEESPPPPPPKIKSSPLPCRPPPATERISMDSRISIDSRSSMDSRTTIDSVTTIDSSTTLDSSSISRNSIQSCSSSGSDATIADYVDMTSTSSSYMDMKSVQRTNSKTLSKPPAVLPKPSSSDSSSGYAVTSDESSDRGSEYMPMSELPPHIKPSHSESAIKKQLSADGDYMSPSEAKTGPKRHPTSLPLAESHQFHSTSDIKREVTDHWSIPPEIPAHQSKKPGDPALPLSHQNRSMSESDTSRPRFAGRIGSPLSPNMPETVFEKGHQVLHRQGRDRSASASRKCSSDDDMTMNQRHQSKGFFSKLKNKMGGGRKMSCPPEAIKESLDQYHKRNQQQLKSKPSEENRDSNISTSSSSSHEGHIPDENATGEEQPDEPVRARKPKKTLFGGKNKDNRNDVRRKSVRIDKMKKDKNLQLLELPTKRK